MSELRYLGLSAIITIVLACAAHVGTDLKCKRHADVWKSCVLASPACHSAIMTISPSSQAFDFHTFSSSHVGHENSCTFMGSRTNDAFARSPKVDASDPVYRTIAFENGQRSEAKADEIVPLSLVTDCRLGIFQRRQYIARADCIPVSLHQRHRFPVDRPVSTPPIFRTVERTPEEMRSWLLTSRSVIVRLH